MAHLWVRDEAERWAVLPLGHEAFTLAANPPQPIRRPLGEGDAFSSILLVSARGAQSPDWVLVAAARSGVSVNGVPLAAGMRVVVDRDEIHIPGAGSLYFSTESLARVEELPGSGQTLFCPRCKQGIENASSAVKCPGCGVWHHQTEELNCWTYSEVCALCAQPTDLSAGFQWTPEEL
ncbi:MAG: PHD finger domain-containing protein [Acidobacteriota bacterium]